MTNLFKIHDNQLVPVQRKALAREEMLEHWIAESPDLIGLDVLIIGRQITTAHGGRIDILAMDRDGALTVIEVKRDRTPRDVVAQTLDYASWVASLTPKKIHDIATDKLNRPLEGAFLERFDTPLPENLNGSHSMVIVASELDPSSRRIVEYLAEEHDLAINTIFFNVFEQNGEQLLATDWLLDQQQVTERAESKKKLPWSGLWYANVGDGPSRSWEDMRRYGFLAAGGGRFYSGRLEQLSVGEPVFAYQKKSGYVGYGTVTHTSVPARDFLLNGEPLLEQDLHQPELGHDQDDPELAEYVVGVDWKTTFPINDARTFTGVFANQNVVCKLRDQATIEFLKREFGVGQD